MRKHEVKKLSTIWLKPMANTNKKVPIILFNGKYSKKINLNTPRNMNCLPVSFFCNGWCINIFSVL